MNKDLVVIGGGPAGLSAAYAAYKKGLKDILIIDREEELGGILKQCIHTGFGIHYFKEELTGPEYAERFIESIEKNDIEYMLNTKVLDVSSDKVITAINENNGLFFISAKAVVLAMGCRERTRGALNIPGTRPSGIFTAGTAQKFINIDGYMPGEKAVILGSGDIGLIMARRMALEGAKVEMVLEIMPYSGGLIRNISQCLDDYNIPLLLNHTVTKIHGDERLTGITIAKVDKRLKPIHSTEKYVKCDTLLLSVGLIPENELSKNIGVEIDTMTNGPVVDERMETSVPGVYACGNVLHVHDLVDFVTEESALAGKSAANSILNEGKKRREKKLNTIAEKGVRYIVPQMINKQTKRNRVKLFFRVDNIYKDAKIIVSSGKEVLLKKKKSYLAPGEIQSLILKQKVIKELKKDIHIEIKQKGK